MIIKTQPRVKGLVSHGGGRTRTPSRSRSRD